MKHQNYAARRYEDLRQLLRQAVQENPNRTAFMQKENGVYHSYRYGRYYGDVNGLGTALWSMGLREGKRILLVGGGCYEWVTAYMAVACGDCVVVPVNPELSEEETLSIARFTEADAVICADALCCKFETLREHVRVIPFSSLKYLIRKGKQRIKDGERDYLNIKLDTNGMCAIMFSSGMDGTMRGVMLSHRNLCFDIFAMQSMVYVNEKDVFLSVLPLHHIYECTCGFLCPLSVGCTVAFSEGLRQLGQNLKEIRPTVMNCVPAILDGIYRRMWEQIRNNGAETRVRRIIDVTNAIPNPKLQLSAKQTSLAALHKGFGGRLRLMLVGGAPASEETLGGFRDLGFLVLQGYGMTECASVMALNRDTRFKDSAAGLPLPNTLLDIVNMQEDGIGEIRYRGENIMLGYYRMPKRTQEVIRDGWFYTGDLGCLDQDGFLHVVGRLQNMIMRENGKKVFPEELEALLRCSHFVKEVIVVSYNRVNGADCDLVALIHPNTEYVAEVYGKDNITHQTDLALRRAVAEVNGNLPTYKQIDFFLIQPNAFPKTATSKVKRQGLQESFRTAYQAMRRS